MNSQESKNDSELLHGLRNADNEAVREIYRLALPAVIQWVKENSGTESDARDVFQEAILALYKKLESGSFQLTCTLKSFIRIMCRNIWLAKIRNKSRQVSPLAGLEHVQVDEDTIAHIELAEKRSLYFKHFEQLGADCQNILKWFFDKTPLKEIAGRLDTTESYIKKKKFKCKEKLIKAIQKDPLFNELKAED